MTKSNMNTLTAFLLISVIIGVGIFMGSNSLIADKNVIYYDWDSNQDLSLDSGVTIFTANDSEYKSVTFDGDYDYIINNTKDYVISFKDKVNISELEEYTIEYQFEQNLDRSSFVFDIVDNEMIRNNYNDSVENLLTESESSRLSIGDIPDILGQTWFEGDMGQGRQDPFIANGFDFGRFVGGNNVTNVKLRFNNVDKYVIITKTADDNVETSFYTYDNLNLDLSGLDNSNVFDLTELRFIIEQKNPYTNGYNKIQGVDGNISSDSFTMDYVKLSYVLKE